jgi:hypothetical protein
MADPISDVNAGIMNTVTSINFANILGWIAVVIILVGAAVFGYFTWRDKKLYNKNITAFEIVGMNYIPVLRDKAKVIKIGTGGFEILYLKKMKTWKVAYGGRVGKADYYFFIGPDGYWMNSMLSANVMQIDKGGGLIPVVTTNPNMRAQYTSLEKQIDTLHADKKSWMEKYGGWVAAIGFVLVAGVMLWLCYKEFVTAMSGLQEIIGKEAEILDKVNMMLANSGGAPATTVNTGLVPI